MLNAMEEDVMYDDGPETGVGNLESFLSHWREELQHRPNVLDHTIANDGEA